MTCASCAPRLFSNTLFKQRMYYIQSIYQYSHRLQFKVTKRSTSTTSFRTRNFDHRFLLGTHIHCADISTYTQNTLQHIISSVAIVRCWRCAWLPSGCTDGPIWLGVILRYQPPKLPWRRQHDAFRRLVFWFNVIFPTTFIFSGNLCCFRYAVVRLVRSVSLNLCLVPRHGVPRE